MEEIYIQMAESYADLMASKYRNRLLNDFRINDYRKITYGEDGPPNSILGAVFVGMVTGIIKMIVNFVKYVSYCIANLIQSMELLPRIVGGLVRIAESSTPYYIKVANPKIFKMRIDNLKTIIDRRLVHNQKHIDAWLSKGGSTNLKDLKAMLDPEFFKDSYFDEKFVQNTMVASLGDKFTEQRQNKLKKDAIKFMKDKYNKSIKDNDPKLMKVNDFIICRDSADIRETITEYKNNLQEYAEVTQDMVNYYKSINERANKLNKQLTKLQQNPEYATLEDQLFIEYANIMMYYITKEQQNILESSLWVKNEIVLNLIAISEKL